jgi:hypothetical protein
MAAIIQQLKTNLCQLPDILVRVIFTFCYHLKNQRPAAEPGV